MYQLFLAPFTSNLDTTSQGPRQPIYLLDHQPTVSFCHYNEAANHLDCRRCSHGLYHLCRSRPRGWWRGPHVGGIDSCGTVVVELTTTRSRDVGGVKPIGGCPPGFDLVCVGYLLAHASSAAGDPSVDGNGDRNTCLKLIYTGPDKSTAQAELLGTIILFQSAKSRPPSPIVLRLNRLSVAFATHFVREVLGAMQHRVSRTKAGCYRVGQAFAVALRTVEIILVYRTAGNLAHTRRSRDAVRGCYVLEVLEARSNTGTLQQRTPAFLSRNRRRAPPYEPSRHLTVTSNMRWCPVN